MRRNDGKLAEVYAYRRLCYLRRGVFIVIRVVSANSLSESCAC
jgi:hypothetical protein